MLSKLDPLPAESLCTRCEPNRLDFETTRDLPESLVTIVGQERVLEALRFGVEIQKEGYNLFALGPPGSGKYSITSLYLRDKVKNQPAPSDWCYVNNFADSRKPIALEFPAGAGRVFQKDVETLVEELKTAIPAVFESDDYRTRKQIIEEEFRERRDNAFEELREQAKKEGLALLRTPEGLAFAPVKEGNVLTPEEFRKLSEKERSQFDEAMKELQGHLQPILREIPRWEREGRERVKELNRELTTFAVGHPIDELRKKCAELTDVVAFLEAFQQDVVENSESFLKTPESPVTLPGLQQPREAEENSLFRRYRVSLLVEHDSKNGAPIVYEDNPSYQNLVGRVEHIASMGALITDFTLIKPGALHRANGGYLVLDADRVLMQPYAWEGLKRALRSKELRIESLGQVFSIVSTVTLEPQAIPLQVKVILLGDRLLYYLLSRHDPEFDELFKVAVDFEDRIQRNEENDLAYSRFIAHLIRQEELKPFDRTAVARVIDQSARLIGDGERLSIHRRSVTDLLREADYWASVEGHEIVGRPDVQKAVEAQIRRSDRVRTRIQEEIQRETILIDTEGEQVGQINGLSVFSLGQQHFGQPSRITARVRMGRGEVIDIEREVDLGGPIHSKGVMILGGFLGARYSHDHPLSLSATLAFEQSYGEVDGDSASSAELYALLSALSELPLKQSIAVTGSVNQHGQVQAIGGVNEKIEGFFDVCRARGLDGRHGVIIPASNVKNLMLRDDVVEASRKGRFQVYAVRTIDEGIEILTGVPAGVRDEEGNFPQDTVNRRVEECLYDLAHKQAAFSRVESAGLDHENDCE